MKMKYVLDIQLFAEEPPKQPTDDKPEDKPEDKRFTQAEVDEIIAKRLARETKKGDKQPPADKVDLTKSKEAKKVVDEDGEEIVDPAAKALDEDSKAKALETRLLLANQRLVSAAAQAEALKLEVSPQYIDAVVKLADLTTIEVAEDGAIDTGEISKRIAEVLKTIPMLAKPKEDTDTGFKIGGDKQTPPAANDWSNKNKTAAKPWNKFQK